MTQSSVLFRSFRRGELILAEAVETVEHGGHGIDKGLVVLVEGAETEDVIKEIAEGIEVPR